MSCATAMILVTLAGLIVGGGIAFAGIVLLGDSLLPEADDAAWKPRRPPKTGTQTDDEPNL